jgi:hypothetical protein
MIASLGGAGAGLVCGWLIGLRVIPERRWSATAAAAAAFAFAVEALALADWPAAAALLAAVPVGLLVQGGWRGVLQARCQNDGSKGSFRA